MRALIAREGRVRLEERPTPEPGGSEVVVATAGSGINRADLLQLRGAHLAPPGWPADIPGLEVAGTVAAVGPRTSTRSVGDRVFGIVGGGAHATHVLTPESLLAPVPHGLDLEEAGGVAEVFVTAHDALVTQAGLRSGERVLIHGVGSGVGTAATQLVRALGATSVGTARTPAKLERAKELGLDEGVVAGENMAKEIGEVDVVLDLVGGDYAAVDAEVCRPTGRIVLIGLLAGSSAHLDLGLLLYKRLTLRGTVLRGRPDYLKAAAMSAFGREVAPLFSSGALRPVVDRLLPLEEAQAGYDALAGNQTFGKIVLTAEG
ncbi:zinc-binding dehydrogenase [soil metagenome]